MPSQSLLPLPSEEQTPPIDGPIITEPVDPAVCSIVTLAGASLSAAMEQFSQQCPERERDDCDPVEGDRWMCSTDNITSSTPIPTDLVVPIEPVVTVNPITPVDPTNGVCESEGASLTSAIEAYDTMCPDIPRADCDPIRSDRWVCSSVVIGSAARGSAGFRNRSSFFVSTALQSEFSNEWNTAFNYLNPNERLDFSDTVELLYIIDNTETGSVDDFARTYLQ